MKPPARLLLWSTTAAVLLAALGYSALRQHSEATLRSECVPAHRHLAVALNACLDSPEDVPLGDAPLTTGVPGQGPLSAAALAAWLDKPENHRRLTPVLPLGMNAGQNQIQGLADNPLTRAKIELGRQLFFDTRLSADNTVSCASCHQPGHGYAAPTRYGVGVGGQEGTRNTPSAMNRLLSTRQFWDGRSPSLEDQAIRPIANRAEMGGHAEMGSSHQACIAKLSRIAGYRMQFERLFDRGLTIENVGRALACFERVIVTGPSPWDYHERLARFEKAYEEDLADADYLAEEEPELLDEHERLKADAAAHPLSESAQRGAELFFSSAVGCAQCHAGANFTDELYHNLGVGMEGYDAALPPDGGANAGLDWGRHPFSDRQEHRVAFKTPTLRNVAQTPPYMHDGSQATLADVVEWYDRGGHPNPWLSEKIKPLKLTDQQKADLVAFLEALTGALPEVEEGRLPE